MTSMSESDTPVLASTLRVAGTGAKPMIRGATPATAVPNTRARGVRLYFFAAASDASSSAHEPSLMPDALPGGHRAGRA